MTRLLALAALAVVLWIFLEIGWIRLKRALGAGHPAPPLPRKPETLLQCSGCGVYVPRRQVAGGRCERCRIPERARTTTDDHGRSRT